MSVCSFVRPSGESSKFQIVIAYPLLNLSIWIFIGRWRDDPTSHSSILASAEMTAVFARRFCFNWWFFIPLSVFMLFLHLCQFSISICRLEWASRDICLTFVYFFKTVHYNLPADTNESHLKEPGPGLNVECWVVPNQYGLLEKSWDLGGFCGLHLRGN